MQVVLCRKVEEFRRTAISGSGGDASAVVKCLLQGDGFTPKIGEPVEAVDIAHQFPGELAALFSPGQPLGGMGFTPVNFPAKLFDLFFSHRRS